MSINNDLPLVSSFPGRVPQPEDNFPPREPTLSTGEKTILVADKIILKEKSEFTQDIEEDVFFGEEEVEDISNIGNKLESIGNKLESEATGEKIHSIAEKTLDIKKANESLTETHASLEEGFATHNLSNLASYNLSKVNNYHLQEDVSKLTQAMQLINENNPITETEMPSEITRKVVNDDKDAYKLDKENLSPHKQVKKESLKPVNSSTETQITNKNLVDIQQKFISLNLGSLAAERTDKVIGTAVLNLKVAAERKGLGIDEHQAHGIAEAGVKKDVIHHGNANFTAERLENIENKILDECRASKAIFKKNPDGTPSAAPLTNEEFEDLKTEFRELFRTSLHELGLIQKNESDEPKTEQEPSQVQAHSTPFSERSKTSPSLKDYKVTFIINNAADSGIMTESQVIKLLTQRWAREKLEENERVEADLKHFNIKTKEIERQEFKGSVLKADQIARIILKNEVAKSQRSQ